MSYEIVCQACLSNERALFPIRKFHSSFIKEIIQPKVKKDGGVCWECKRMIVKFSAFKKQVELCQKALSNCDKDQVVKCFSNLSFSPTHTYNFQSSNSDPLTAETLEVETKEIKQEIELKTDTDFDFDDVNDPADLGNEVYIQENVVKEEIRLKNKVRKGKVKKKKCKVNAKADYANMEDVKDKFVEIEFTEEEMLKSREEKRNHPNFKKLPYNCATCVLGFTRKETYDLHLVKKHEKGAGTQICPVCQVRFSTPTSLARHVKKHYHCYRCKLCSYETTELWSALSHCRTKHSADTEDCIHCPQCSFVAKYVWKSIFRIGTLTGLKICNSD